MLERAVPRNNYNILVDGNIVGEVTSGTQSPTLNKGIGIGYQGDATGEICFNTSLTGYQEIISDPSYAGQIINFTFPHIGLSLIHI